MCVCVRVCAIQSKEDAPLNAFIALLIAVRFMLLLTTSSAFLHSAIDFCLIYTLCTPYTYIHIYVYVYIWIYMHTYTRTHVHVNIRLLDLETKRYGTLDANGSVANYANDQTGWRRRKYPQQTRFGCRLEWTKFSQWCLNRLMTLPNGPFESRLYKGDCSCSWLPSWKLKSLTGREKEKFLWSSPLIELWIHSKQALINMGEQILAFIGQLKVESAQIGYQNNKKTIRIFWIFSSLRLQMVFPSFRLWRVLNFHCQRPTLSPSISPAWSNQLSRPRGIIHWYKLRTTEPQIRGYFPQWPHSRMLRTRQNRDHQLGPHLRHRVFFPRHLRV